VLLLQATEPLGSAAQVWPQAPQFFLSVAVLVSQPSVSLLIVLQLEKPAAQALAVTLHPPAVQVTGGLALRLGSAAQSCAQVPQLAGSLCLLTHFDPQRSGFGDVQLEEHMAGPPAVEQRAVGATHMFMQLPQVVGLVRSVSHPSSGLAEQWPKPLAQPDG